MQMSEQINELAAALAKAQAVMEGAVKDSANPHFKSKYADLASIWAACKPALTANNIAVVQSLGNVDGGHWVACTTTLMHASGQWLRDTFALPVTKADAQGYGSAATYVRRYALAAMVGVAPEDDDGNGAVGDKTVAPMQRKPVAPAPRITSEQLADLRAALDVTGSDIAKFCDVMKVEALPDLTQEQYTAAQRLLAKKLSKAKPQALEAAE